MKLGFLILTALTINTAYAEPIFHAPDKTCVAWKVQKRMFLVRNLEPVGVSCQVKMSWSGVETTKALVLEIPLDSFDSGEKERDLEVGKILGAAVQPQLKISTMPLSESDVAQLRSGPEVNFAVNLRFANQDHKLSFQGQWSGPAGQRIMKGQVKTEFKALGMSPPSVAGGAVAQVKEPIELHLQLLETDLPTIER